MMGLAFPKSNGPTRAEAKKARRAAEALAIRECYRLVDLRDQHTCRVCGKRCSPHAVGLLEHAHRHHLEYRSLGGMHVSENVATLCQLCHDAIHVKGVLRLSGDANQKDPITRRLNGIKVERITEHGWTTEKWV